MGGCLQCFMGIDMGMIISMDHSFEMADKELKFQKWSYCY